jgi:multidrug efflux pump subunit AcrB
MHIAEFSVRRPQLTMVAFGMAVALGLQSLFAIPLSEDPQFPISTYAVIAVHPGASPTDIEQLVVDPIEDRFNALDDLKSLETVIQDGVSVTTVEFEAATDPAKKYDEVVRELNALRPELPPDLYRLEVEKFDLNNVNIAQLALVSESAPWRVLEEQARRLADRLEQVPGVRTVERFAYPAREVVVTLDPGRLAQRRIAPTAVLRAIASENANIPAGAADAGARKFNVKTSGSYRDAEEVASTVVTGDGRSTVHVHDVAEVQWGHEDLRHIGRLNGEPAAFVTANMKRGQRIGEVRDGLWRELDAFERTLPPGVRLERPFDQSVNVGKRLTRLSEDFGIAIALVLLTLLPLGVRASLVVMVSIPLSLAIGVALLYFTGFSINQLSIVGFVIALGLLVDDSIVVVENIARFLRAGHSRDEAAIRATRQITVAVLGCTATLVAAFIPIFMLPGNAGKYIASLPAAVTFTVLASLVISLTIVPFLASRMLARHEAPEGNRFLQALNRAIEFTYGRWLHRALARPRLVLVASLALFVLALGLVPVIGFSLFPKADTPQFLVRVATPRGSSLAETDRAVRHVEAVLRERPEVGAVLANVGHGNPFVYYNVSSESERTDFGEVFVLLRTFDPRRTPRMLDSLQARFDQYPGARIEVKVFENGPPIDAPIAMRVVGPELDTLRALATEVQRVLDTTPGTWNVVNPLQLDVTDLRVAVDTRKAGLHGVPTVEVDQTVRMAIAGAEAGRVRAEDGEEYAIRVRLPRENLASGLPPSLDGAPSLEALDRLYVTAVTGAPVPLRQVADLRLEASVPSIQHHEKSRAVVVAANVRSGFNTDRVTQAVLAQLGAMRLPEGYRIIPAGEIESRQESFGGIGVAIILTVFIILAILVMEFGSFRSTLIVASVIPLGVVGGLIALALTGYSLSFTAMIGFIALLGIEIKNSILLVDFTNQLRQEGRGIDEAVEAAGRIRFLPILLTTMTAVGGLLPLAIQNSSLYSPIAVVLIGGLLSSTLLARLVTPVMYKLLPPTIEARATSDAPPLLEPAAG